MVGGSEERGRPHDDRTASAARHGRRHPEAHRRAGRQAGQQRLQEPRLVAAGAGSKLARARELTVPLQSEEELVK